MWFATFGYPFAFAENILQVSLKKTIFIQNVLVFEMN